MKRKVKWFVLLVAMTVFALSQITYAETGQSTEQSKKSVRTVMLYLCGSNLESESAMGTHNLHQILKAKYSANEDVRFVVMTGGSEEWHLESNYISDPDGLMPAGEPKNKVSGKYNQIWEAFGADAKEHAGQMVLRDGDGITGADGQAVVAEKELMHNPDVLKAFINYSVKNYPAEKYDLILWNHGGGPSEGFGIDEHDPDGGTYMDLPGIVDALYNNLVVDSNSDGKADGKFDFVDFDACLMGNIEMAYMYSDCADYYIASPELEPGYGQPYEGWLNELGKNPGMDTYALGKIIVDDFYDYYETGEGKGQDGTLAVTNLGKLVAPETGLTDALIKLSKIMKEEANPGQEAGDILFYDELYSAKESLNYGFCPLVDLGNLSALLGIRNTEITKAQIKDGVFDINTPYSDAAKGAVSQKISSVLEDESIIYAKGTSGVKTKNALYRESNGEIGYDPLQTSGVHIFFPIPGYIGGDYEEFDGYSNAVTKRINTLPDGSPEKEFLTSYRQAIIDYILIKETSDAVNTLINEENMAKDKIDYAAVKKQWTTEYDDGIDEGGRSQWNAVIKGFLDLRGSGESEEAKAWLDGVIKQQAAEAVLEKNISSKTVKEKNGEAYRITITDTKKRVIDRVHRNVIAELPAVEKYRNEIDDEYEKEVIGEAGRLPLGSIDGDLDIDSLLELPDVDDEDFAETILRWYNSTNNTYYVNPLEQKWYAIRDADGEFHVASIYNREGDNMYVPASYDKAKDGEVIFMKFVKGKLMSVQFNDGSGGIREIDPKNLKNELVVMPIIFNDRYGDALFIPISEKKFTLSKDNYNSITMEFTNLSNISDIKDIDGDRKALDSVVVVDDIYGNAIDITDKVNNPTAELIDIGLARIKPGIQDEEGEDAKELVPEVTYDGVALRNGIDYELEPLDDNTVLKDLGDYEVILKGKGKFTGLSLETFSIIRSEATAQHYIKEARETLKEAQENFDANNPESIQKLFNAQNALADAQNELLRTKETLSKEEQTDLQEQIDKLGRKIEDMTAELAGATVDISKYKVTMKTSMPYTGKAIKPKVVINGLNEAAYTVQYSNNVKIGTAKVTITAKGNGYKGKITKTFKIVKGKNTIKAKGKKVKIKAKKLKKKKYVIKKKKAYKISKAKGKVTYKLGKVKKAKFKKYFKVNKKNGNITVKKKLKKGTYKVTVKVTAAGNKYYKKATKKVTVKVVVK